MRINELFDICPKSKRSASFGKGSGKYPFFTSSNIIDKFVDIPDYSGEYLIIGDGGTGNVKYYNGEFSASDHNYLLKPKNNCNPRCVRYFLKKDDYKILNDGFKGCGIQNVSKKYVQHINYHFNHKYTENYIVSSLERIEDNIDSLNKTSTQLDSLVKSLFVEMFGNPNSIAKRFKLTDAFEIRDDLRKPINDVTRKKMKKGILYPYYGANGQVDSINDYLMDCEALCVAEDCGLYGANQASSYIVNGKCWVNNHAHVLICKDTCNILFANTYFYLLDISQEVNGSTRKKLTQACLKELPIIIPPIELQNKFASIVSLIDKSRFVVQKEIKALQELLDKKMDEYFGD